MITLRTFRPDDGPDLARIFHQAVQVGAATHYAQAERNAWCAQRPPDDWAVRRLVECTTFVACADDPVGFASVDGAGYLDMFFVAPSNTGQGVARLLHDAVVTHAATAGVRRLSTQASHCARPVLAHMGWDVVRPNSVERDGITLRNWVMVGSIDALARGRE